MIEYNNSRIWQVIAVIVGLCIAFLLIIQLNGAIVVDACIDHGGRYIAEQRHCLDLLTDYKHSLSPTPIMYIGYGLLVLIIPFLCKRLADAIVAWRQKNTRGE